MSERNVLQVIMQNAYTDEIFDKKLSGTYKTLNDVMDIMLKSFDISRNIAISIYDKDLYCYVYCGVYPFDKIIHLEETGNVIIINLDFSKSKTNIYKGS
jgi:hypothetical protein